MPRKVIIDCDMGTDDATALCLAMFDSRLDILAVTACEGCVSSDQANHNLQAVIGQIDPPRYPRLGLASPAEGAPAVNTTFLYGDDGLGNSELPVSRLQHIPPAEKVIIDLVRADPGEVTILCLGPLTNVARALQREPSLAGMIHRLIAVGGTIQVPGNITPAAEFNFFFDPLAARAVLRSRVTMTLVPLDVTAVVPFGLDLLEDLPDTGTRVGYFLHQVLPHAFRSFRQKLGCEVITLNDVVGSLVLSEPGLFRYSELAGDVEVTGELTRGATVFDRRSLVEWPVNLEVASEVDGVGVRTYIRQQLRLAGWETPRGA